MLDWKRIIIILIFVILIIGIITGVYIVVKNKNEKKEIVEYTPQEEITEEQMRQTMVSLYFKNNNIKFNIILMDAPYKLEVAEEIINLVNKYDLLYNNGILVLEYSTDKLKDNYNNLTLIKSKKYNDKYVNIYHKVID